LNVCPVYQRIGGHAYGWVYSGPIGSLVTPQFLGIQRAKYLPLASTLCRACDEVCPVRIPLPDLLLTLRRRIVEQHGLPWLERKMMEIWGVCQTSPGNYQAAWGLARIGQEFTSGLLPAEVHLPEKNFHRIWEDGQD